MKTKHLPWKTFTVLGCTAIQFSLLPSCFWSLNVSNRIHQFPWTGLTLDNKMIFFVVHVIYYFIRRRHRLARVLGFTEHKHVLSLSIMNYINQRTLDNLKILHTPNCSEFSGVQMLLWSCFSFSRKQGRQRPMNWGSMAQRSRNNSKQRYFAWGFQLIYTSIILLWV